MRNAPALIRTSCQNVVNFGKKYTRCNTELVCAENVFSESSAIVSIIDMHYRVRTHVLNMHVWTQTQISEREANTYVGSVRDANTYVGSEREANSNVGSEREENSNAGSAREANINEGGAREAKTNVGSTREANTDV